MVLALVLRSKRWHYEIIVWPFGPGRSIASNRRNVVVITDVSRNDTLADYKLKLSEIPSAPMRRQGRKVMSCFIPLEKQLEKSGNF